MVVQQNTDITSKLREGITIIRNEGENYEESTNCRAYHQRTGITGRPKVIITQEQLEYFIENAFSAVDIASRQHTYSSSRHGGLDHVVRPQATTNDERDE